MGYRKIKPRLVHIDSLVEECRMFSDTQEAPYCCMSRSKVKQEHGAQSCAVYDCPLGSEANLEDMKKYDEELYEEYKTEKYDPSEMGANWLVQYREVV